MLTFGLQRRVSRESRVQDYTGKDLFMLISSLKAIDIVKRISIMRGIEQSNLEDEEISVKTIVVTTVK